MLDEGTVVVLRNLPRFRRQFEGAQATVVKQLGTRKVSTWRGQVEEILSYRVQPHSYDRPIKVPAVCAYPVEE